MPKTKNMYIIKCVIIAIIILFGMYYMFSLYYESFEGTTIESLKKSLETTTKKNEITAIKEKLMQALNTQLTQLTNSLTGKTNEETIAIRYQIADNLRDQMLYTTINKEQIQLQSQYEENRAEITKITKLIKPTKQTVDNRPITSDSGTNIDPNIKKYIDEQVASLVPMTMERFI